MSEQITGASLPEETGKVIPFRSHRVSDDHTSRVDPGTEYLHATDLRRESFSPRPIAKMFQVESIKAFRAAEREMLNVAFERISQTLQPDLQSAELSNSFDEWKDILEMASRKVESFSSNHRKVLGSLLSIIRDKDVSDFDNNGLKSFREATNVLRSPRPGKQDVRRIIKDLVRENRAVLMRLSGDELDDKKTAALENMMARLLAKSRGVSRENLP